MANTFELLTDVVRDSSIILRDNLTAGNLCSRQLVESRFANKVGKTVYVKTIPDLGAASEFTSTTSATDVTETKTAVVVDKHFYQRVDLTSDEMTYELDDFVEVVAGPCALSLAESVDSYLIDKFSKGFARNLVGTAGNSPSTLAHISAAKKKIFDNRGTYRNVASIINSAAQSSFEQVDKFTSVDYGPERPQALRDGTLGRVLGASFFPSQNAGTIDQGDIAGTVLTDGDPGTSNTIHIDALTAATGTIYAGTRFTVADDSSSTTYTVTADATIASNECDLSVYPAADASVATDKAVTFETAFKQNLLYNTNAAVAAIIAPAPMRGTPSAVQSYDGLSVRASFEGSTSTLADTFVLDVYVGGKVIYPGSGTVYCG